MTAGAESTLRQLPISEDDVQAILADNKAAAAQNALATLTQAAANASPDASALALKSDSGSAGAGQLLGVPARPGILVNLDPQLIEGQRFDGQPLQGGTCFGSLRLASAEEATEAARTRRDSNSTRYAGIAALWDLCLGLDLQLLHDLDDDSSVWSFDHGLWFDNAEADWSVDSLRRMVDCSWPPFRTDEAIEDAALFAVADHLESLTMDRVAELVCGVPVEWEVPEVDLRALAGFIWARRRLTAQQLRAWSRKC